MTEPTILRGPTLSAFGEPDHYIIRCPGCGKAGEIEADMAKGIIPILCPVPGNVPLQHQDDPAWTAGRCGYRETHVLVGRPPVGVPTDADREYLRARGLDAYPVPA